MQQSSFVKTAGRPGKVCHFIFMPKKVIQIEHKGITYKWDDRTVAWRIYIDGWKSAICLASEKACITVIETFLRSQQLKADNLLS